MLQNRVVGGATMGARRAAVGEAAGSEGPLPRVPAFGPLGYLNLAVPTVLLVAFLAAVEAGWPEPGNGGVSLGFLAISAAVAALGAWTRRRGSAADMRYHSSRRTLAYRVQRWAPVAIGALIVIALVAHFAGLHMVVVAVLGFVVGALAGVAPSFFQKA